MSWYSELSPLPANEPRPVGRLVSAILGIGAAGSEVIERFAVGYGGTAGVPLGAIVFDGPLSQPGPTGSDAVEVMRVALPEGPLQRAEWAKIGAPARSRIGGREALAEELDLPAGGSRIRRWLERHAAESTVWIVSSAADPLASGALLGLLASPRLGETMQRFNLVLLGPAPGEGDRAVLPTLRELDRMVHTGQFEASPAPVAPPRPGAILWFGRPSAEAGLAADALRVLVELGDGTALASPFAPDSGFGTLRLIAPEVRALVGSRDTLRRLVSLEIAREVLVGVPGPSLLGPPIAPEGQSRPTDHTVTSIAPYLRRLEYHDGAAGRLDPPRRLPDRASATLLELADEILNGPPHRAAAASGRSGGLERLAAFLATIRETLALVERADEVMPLIAALLRQVENWQRVLGGTTTGGTRSVLALLTRELEQLARTPETTDGYERRLDPGGKTRLGELARSVARDANRGTEIGGPPAPLARVGWLLRANLAPGAPEPIALRLAIAPSSYRGPAAPPEFSVSRPAEIARALVELAASYLPILPSGLLDQAIEEDDAALSWLAEAVAPFSNGMGQLEYRLPPERRATTTAWNFVAYPADSLAKDQIVAALERRAQPQSIQPRRWNEPDRVVLLAVTMPILVRDTALASERVARRGRTGRDYVVAAEQRAAWIEERFTELVDFPWLLAASAIDCLVRPRLAAAFLRAAIVGLVREETDGWRLHVGEWPPVVLPRSARDAASWLTPLRHLAVELPTDGRLGRPLSPENIRAFTDALALAAREAEATPEGENTLARSHDQLIKFWRARPDGTFQPSFHGSPADDERVLLTVLTARDQLGGLDD